MGCYFLCQGIFPTQRSNPSLLHCREILHCLSHQGSPVPSLINHRSTFFFLEEEEIREVGREKSRSCLLSTVDREYFLMFLNNVVSFLKNIYVFWLCWVLVATHSVFIVACGFLSCDLWDSFPSRGQSWAPPVLEMQSLGHWTTSEVPILSSWSKETREMGRAWFLHHSPAI